jgi:putative tricarboxylic transport membrane protein
MKKIMIAGLLVAVVSAVLFANGSSESTAASFPSKPIHLIVYTGAGGAGDILARKAVSIAARYTNTTFVVENKPGAGGIVTMEYVRSRPADGYTLMYVTRSNITKLASTTTNINPTKDFDWISMLQIDPECVITNNKSGVVTWQQVVADAKAKNGKQLWLGPAAGGLDNVTAERIWKAAGIKATWVPFSSGGEAKAALLGEQGVTYTGNPGEIIGKPDFSIAAICLDKRLPQFPNVPTFRELGVKGVSNEIIWRGFAVKKGTPDSVIAWYNDLFKKISQDKDWVNTYTPQGVQLVDYTKDKFNKIVETDYQGYKAAFGK